MDRLYMKLAWLLPKKLVSWCGIRIIALASTTVYSNVEMGELKAMEVMDVWNDHIKGGTDGEEANTDIPMDYELLISMGYVCVRVSTGLVDRVFRKAIMFWLRREFKPTASMLIVEKRPGMRTVVKYFMLLKEE